MEQTVATIRNAELKDAVKLAELADKTFRDTFAADNSAEDMELHCLSSYGVAIQSREIADPERVTVVAEIEDRLVAFAQLRWGDFPDCVPGDSPVEIQRLYVDSAWHGTGLAHELMSACLEIVERRSSDVAWLGVWEKNPRAIAFYEKFAFHEVGDHVFFLGKDAQRDIILVLPVFGHGKEDERFQSVSAT